MKTRYGIEWPTLALLAACYAFWYVLIRSADAIGSVAAIPLLSLCLALFSSLQHEVLHGHPTRWAWFNTLIALPPLGIVIPFHRFQDLHLSHHRDQVLTDPYDDPESYYVHPDRWGHYPGRADSHRTCTRNRRLSSIRAAPGVPG